MGVFVFEWEEDVVLLEGFDCGVPTSPQNSISDSVDLIFRNIIVRYRNNRTHLVDTSTLTGSLKLALCNFATFVVIVAENK